MTTTTPAPDYTGFAAERVVGQVTVPAVVIGPGGATLNGTVVGPQGPVAKATVEVDRLVGSQQASKEVSTAADGSWSVPAILGGRYRVRAWQTPSLAMITPQIFFLADNQASSLTLQVSSFTGQDVTSAVNPQSTVVGGTVNVVVAVSNQSVSPNGIVVYGPAVGVSVVLTTGANLVAINDPATTDSNGDATFSLTCLAPGTGAAVGTTGTGISTSAPPVTCDQPYVPSPSSSTTTTTLLGGPTTSTPPGATSTTSPGTTTTVPPAGLLP